MIYRRFGKRLFDIIISVFGLIVLLLPMLMISLLIKFDSKGTVFFLQKRWGINRKDFTIYKFRTMIPNAFEIGGLVTSESDNRITRIGSVLRRTSLDELPQFINIIKGDMSIIGPRPCIPHEYDEFETDANYRKRFNALPGLFCSVDVDLRSAASFEKQFEMDAEYIENITFTNDIKIFFGVFKTVLSGKNVYRDE